MTETDSTALNLKRICLIRGFVLTGQWIAMIFAVQATSWHIPVFTLSLILTGMTIITIITWWRANLHWPISDPELVLHLLVDVIVLTLVMYQAGGASNPFVSFFLVPVTIAAIILPWRFAWIVATASIVAYSLLLFFYRPLMPIEPHQHNSSFSLHIVGMWFNFAVSAILITYFVVQMSSAIRQRDQALAKVREQRLQDEQLLAIATLAAGTAHELGTPLASMRIIADELQDDPVLPESLKSDVDTLSSQLDLCKNILTRLTNTAQDFNEGRTTSIGVQVFFRTLKEHWQLLRPSVHDAQFTIELPETTRMVMDSTLEQAIINLLNNAADVSPGQVSLRSYIDGEQFIIAIEDEGPGIPIEQASQIGTPFYSTKGKGRGLGLFVSHAAANRYGGELRWENRKSRGSRMELRLPARGVLLDD